MVNNMFRTHRTYSLTTGVKNNSIAVIADCDAITVIYHKTIVVNAQLIRGRWVVTLNNGGWDTASTRIVINTALEQIPGCSGVYLSRHKGQTVVNVNGERVTFQSGWKLDTAKIREAA
jgi:hypothetical protein